MYGDYSSWSAAANRETRKMSSGFYRSVPRNSSPSVSTSQWEKKLDKIFDKMTEQGNQYLILKEKGEKTLDSIINLEKKFDAIENKVNFIEQMTLNQEKKENKCPVPPELSEDVKLLYTKLDTSHQFDPEALYRSPHNTKVSEYLCKQIKGDRYTPREVKKAVHRYYQSRRRLLFTDKKPERAEKVKQNKRKTRISQGQRRLFNARAKMVRKFEEKYWQQLSFGCMSEEDSASEDTNNDKIIIRHTPIWRSESLNLLIAKLDKRLAKSSEKSGKTFKRLRREVGEPVVSSPEVGTPKWAIDKNFTMGPQLQDDDGAGLPLGTEIELPNEDSDVESNVESEGDSDFALELD